MIRIQRILFPTDFFRCADQALDEALYLARRYRAELHMFHAIVLHAEDPHNPSHHFPDVDAIQARLEELAHKDMEAALTEHEATGVAIKQVRTRGISAADAIVGYAQENGIDLIVMGTHGRRGLGHVFLGSVAEEVLRFAPCPVLTIRESEESRPAQDRSRVLAPVDFSEHSRNAVRHGLEIAALHGATLQLLHVIEDSIHPIFSLTGHGSLFQLKPDLREKCQGAIMEMLAEIAGPEVPLEVHVVAGHAARDIVRFADENGTDLIVIATHGWTGLSHLMMGSVAEKVVRRAPCPVLTLKSFGRSILN